MTVFINYLAHPHRKTTLNLTVARVVICLYAIWKVATYSFGALVFFPYFLFSANPLTAHNDFLVFPKSWMWLIPFEQLTVVTLLALVALGWRIRITAFLGAFLLSHLAGMNYHISNEKTFLPIIYFLIFIGLFSHQRNNSASTESVHLTPLKWFLITLSLIYFFTGLAKIQGGDLSFDWASASNLRHILQHNAAYHIHHMPTAARWVMPYDMMCSLAAWGTLFLELGFVIAVFCRLPITLFILGLIGMHLGILATMQLNYLTDMGILFSVFVPWDDVLKKMSLTQNKRWNHRLHRYTQMMDGYTTNCL